MNMYDPRISVIPKRLKKIKNIIGIASAKGGVGKTTIASTLALLLAKKEKYRVGLFDLDLHNPSCHVVLGVNNLEFTEERGIIPPKIHDVYFASILPYVGDNPIPLRGKDISNAIIELITIINWPLLDYLIIDLPPGLGEAFLETMRFMNMK